MGTREATPWSEGSVSSHTRSIVLGTQEALNNKTPTYYYHHRNEFFILFHWQMIIKNTLLPVFLALGRTYKEQLSSVLIKWYGKMVWPGWTWGQEPWVLAPIMSRAILEDPKRTLILSGPFWLISAPLLPTSNLIPILLPEARGDKDLHRTCPLQKPGPGARRPTSSPICFYKVTGALARDTHTYIVTVPPHQDLWSGVRVHLLLQEIPTYGKKKLKDLRKYMIFRENIICFSA